MQVDEPVPDISTRALASVAATSYLPGVPTRRAEKLAA